VLANGMTNPGEIGLVRMLIQLLEVKPLLAPENGLKGKQIRLATLSPNPLTPNMSTKFTKLTLTTIPLLVGLGQPTPGRGWELIVGERISKVSLIHLD